MNTDSNQQNQTRLPSTLQDFPELLPYADEVKSLLSQGYFAEQVFQHLFVGKEVDTQIGRVMIFCRILGGTNYAKLAQQPVKQNPICLPNFQELETLRDHIGMALLCGMTPAEIFENKSIAAYNPKTDRVVEMPAPLAAVSTTRERLQTYCEALLTAIAYTPNGGVNPNFTEVIEQPYIWERTRPVFTAAREVWTLDHVTQGILVMGATGSGKTTATGRMIAQAFLHQNFGGLVLTTKKGEADEWVKLCAACGRGEEVSLVRHNGPLKINILDYETSRPGAGATMAENLVGFFRNLLSVLGNRHGQRTDESFWENAGNQLLRNLFELFLLAKARLDMDTLAEFVVNAPGEAIQRDNEAWRKIPIFGDYMIRAEESVRTAADERQLSKLKQYWLSAFQTLAPNTRSCITFAFSAMTDVLRSRHIYELLCTDTVFITPEQIFNGRIVILDLPIKEFGDAGLLVQAAYKYMFQRAVERRPDQRDNTRPVFLWEDEGQHFFSEFDPVFQQTARSSRVARVLLSQNVNNFYAHLGGGDKAHYLFNSLVGNLNTRIFHANGDMTTNQWASQMFGTAEKTYVNTSSSQQQQFLDPLHSSSTSGVSTHIQREPIVFPDEFSQLRTGGQENGFFSEAYFYRVGPAFKSTGRPFLKAAVPQQFI